MLKNVIENYLSSIREVEFFGPFKKLLEGMDFNDIHLLHGSTEFGKDIIAQKDEDGQLTQYCFQIKVGNINLSKFTNEIKPQLLEIITNGISHPNFNTTIPLQIIFVTTGTLRPPATASFQQFNDYITDTLDSNSIITWEKQKILTDFYNLGIEPFFEMHDSPEFVGRFFNLYSKIKNNEAITSFDITYYTDNWLDLDFNIYVNKLQVWFECYFFSKLLFENNRYYESILFISALCRVLIKNNEFDDDSQILIDSINENIDKFQADFSERLSNNREQTFLEDGFFSIFSYPIICLKSLELLSLKILLNDKIDSETMALYDLILTENGIYRPISDNYGISIFLTALSLIKLSRIDDLKSYLINCTVWLCNRYNINGLVPIGYSRDKEYEQIISENLEGLTFIKRKSSFIAAIILDICAHLDDEELYADIANDFRAIEIIAEFFHVNKTEQLFNYKKIVSQTDHDFSLELNNNHAEYVKYRNDSFEIANSREQLLLLSFLLRDRYFPQLFLKSK